MAWSIGFVALIMGAQAISRWHHLSAMRELRLDSEHKWLGWDSEQAAITDVWGALGLLAVSVAAAAYRIGKRVDALTPTPPEHPIWKELA